MQLPAGMPVPARHPATVYLPALQVYLNTTALTFSDLALSIGFGAVSLIHAKIEKVLLR
jgi:hypothetical protein